MSNSFTQLDGSGVAGQFMLRLAIAILAIIYREISKQPLIVLCGLVIMAASAIRGMGDTMALARNLTPFPRPLAGTNLARRGSHGLVRLPLYTAVICAAVGWLLIRSSWLALAVSLTLVVFADGEARLEEVSLRRQFSDYTCYERRVQRFFRWIS